MLFDDDFIARNLDLASFAKHIVNLKSVSGVIVFYSCISPTSESENFPWEINYIFIAINFIELVKPIYIVFNEEINLKKRSKCS